MRSGRVDLSDVDRLCGDHHEVMLYGFHSLLCIGKIYLLNEFKKQHYTAHTYASPPPCELQAKPGTDTNNRALDDWQISLSNLLIYNHIQLQSGKPPVPLIFVIGADTNAYKITLDYNRIAKKTPDPSYTDAELQHCYELFTATSGDLRQTLDLTFHFFTLKETGNKDKPYKLEQTSPFWHDPAFQNAWQQYHDKNWKKLASEKIISSFPATLFHQSVARPVDSIANRVKQRRSPSG